MHQPSAEVIKAELWRGVAWLALALFGWTALITLSDAVPATATTVVGLPLLTVAVLVVTMIVLRTVTGRDFILDDANSDLVLIGSTTILAIYLGWIFVSGEWRVQHLLLAAVLVAVPFVRIVRPETFAYGTD